MNVNVVIVDDEPSGINVLRKMLEKYVPEVQITGTFDNAEEALLGIRQLNPDLVFSDIEMEEMSGLEMLSNLPDSKFSTVFVTAHPQYSIEAIRNQAFDYLLKPVQVAELLNVFRRYHTNRGTGKTKSSETILLNTSNKMLFVHKEEIIMIKGDGSYCIFYLKSGASEVVSKNLAYYERLIDSSFFFRSHKSYLINLRQVLNLNLENGLEVVLSGDLTASLSSSKKIAFLDAMKTI